MATTIDVIPKPDTTFDIFQANLVNKATTNAVAWGIPAGELTKLTDKQAIWTPAWDAVKVKQTATTAQREAKDIARKNYEKVLRPFIQKWLYRNDLVDNEAILECGLKPRDTEPTPVAVPAVPADVKVTNGDTGELLAQCGQVTKAEYYGCIIMAGQPLPVNVSFVNGQFIVLDDDVQPAVATTTPIAFVMDLNKPRKKKFTGLEPGVTYYVYFYAANRAGVSGLSAPVTKKCW